MKLREFLTVFSNPDRIRIVKDDKAVYTGYLALIQHAENLEELMDAEVKRFSATPEIRHKEWKSVDLWHHYSHGKRRNIPLRICK